VELGRVFLNLRGGKFFNAAPTFSNWRNSRLL
jgi:hypothetical protein